VHRRAGRAVRLLHQRHDHEREGAARSEPERRRNRHPAGPGGELVPVRHAPAHPPGRGALCTGAAVMNATGSSRVNGPTGRHHGGPARRRARLALSRRTFLKASGALIVCFSLTDPIKLMTPSSARAQVPPALPTRLDGWLAIAPDGTVTLFSGKVDLGTGI